jgi:hypothetical protein
MDDGTLKHLIRLQECLGVLPPGKWVMDPTVHLSHTGLEALYSTVRSGLQPELKADAGELLDRRDR